MSAPFNGDIPFPNTDLLFLETDRRRKLDELYTGSNLFLPILSCVLLLCEFIGLFCNTSIESWFSPTQSPLNPGAILLLLVTVLLVVLGFVRIAKEAASIRKTTQRQKLTIKHWPSSDWPSGVRTYEKLLDIIYRYVNAPRLEDKKELLIASRFYNYNVTYFLLQSWIAQVEKSSPILANHLLAELKFLQSCKNFKNEAVVANLETYQKLDLCREPIKILSSKQIDSTTWFDKTKKVGHKKGNRLFNLNPLAWLSILVKTERRIVLLNKIFSYAVLVMVIPLWFFMLFRVFDTVTTQWFNIGSYNNVESSNKLFKTNLGIDGNDVANWLLGSGIDDPSKRLVNLNESTRRLLQETAYFAPTLPLRMVQFFWVIIVIVPTFYIGLKTVPYSFIFFALLLKSFVWLFENFVWISNRIPILNGPSLLVAILVVIYRSRPTIGVCQRALKSFTQNDFPNQWVLFQYRLANIYLENGLNYLNTWENEDNISDTSEDLESAIRNFQSLIDVEQLFTLERRALLYADIGKAYVNRLAGNRSDNIEKAIECYNLALSMTPVETTLIIRIWVELAQAYLKRINGKRINNVEEAIAFLQSAEESCPTSATSPFLWGFIQYNFGVAYKNRTSGDRSLNIEKSIEYLTNASRVDKFVESFMPSLIPWNRPKWYVAYDRQIWLNEADILLELGDAYSAKDQQVGNNGGFQKAIDFYDQASRVRERLAPRFTLDISMPGEFGVARVGVIAQLHKADLLFSKKQWRESIDNYSQVISACEKLISRTYIFSSRQFIAGFASQAYMNMAYCATQLGDILQAMNYIELSKTRLSTEISLLSQKHLGKLEIEEQKKIRECVGKINKLQSEYNLLGSSLRRRTDSMIKNDFKSVRKQMTNVLNKARIEFSQESLSLDEIISAVPHNSVLAIPLIAKHEGVVIIISEQQNQPFSVIHLSVTEKDILGWLYGDEFVAQFVDTNDVYKFSESTQEIAGWVGVFNSIKQGPMFDHERKLTTLTGYLNTLGDRVMQPILHELFRYEIPPHTPVGLMPPGILSIFPLHAARCFDVPNREFFLDYYPVSYFPNFSVANTSKQGLLASYNQSALIVANPTKDLRYTEIEAEAVSSAFDQSNILFRDTARLEDVLREMESYQYLHFACHGDYNGKDPMRSGLILANQQHLTLEQITSLPIRNFRLATLSACETGLIEISRAPNEYLGLPFLFLQTGITGVVSTLWAISDQATSLLMENFYERHLKEGLSPCEALCKSQRWLRNLTRKEIGDYYSSYIRMSSETAFLASQEIILGGDPDDKPYAHPYFWAAFTFSGH